ncbi:MAG: hypothetical protein AVDCRST_MAG93-7406, partial [uncultured Chloroflexia bacterium]
RISGAALRLFARQGFKATGIREIASEAGVTIATMYHYVDTKEQLLLRIMNQGIGVLLRSAHQIVSEVQTSEEKLVALVRMHVVTHGIWRLTMLVGDTELRALTETHREVLVSKRDRYERYWRDVLEEGLSGSVFDIDDPKLAAFALLEMCTGVAHWYSSDGTLSIEDIAIKFADMALTLVNAKRNGEPISVADLNLANLPVFPNDSLVSEEVQTWAKS